MSVTEPIQVNHGATRSESVRSSPTPSERASDHSVLVPSRLLALAERLDPGCMHEPSQGSERQKCSPVQFIAEKHVGCSVYETPWLAWHRISWSQPPQAQPRSLPNPQQPQVCSLQQLSLVMRSPLFFRQQRSWPSSFVPLSSHWFQLRLRIISSRK